MLELFKHLSLRLGMTAMLSPILAFVGGSGEAMAVPLSEIRDRGYITVAVKENRAPLSFVNDGGDYEGYEIEIARRLAEELLGDESAVRFVPVRNAERLNVAIAEEVDVTIAAVTLTEARRRLVDFSYPYYLDGAALIARSPNVAALEDLRFGRIAVLDRSSTVAHVRYILPGAKLEGVRSYAEGLALLESGEVDAFAGDASVLTGWLRAMTEGYRLLPNLLSADPLAVVIPKGDRHDELREEINAALRRWYREGWLQSRAAYWGLPAGAGQFVDLSPAVEGSVIEGERLAEPEG